MVLLRDTTTLKDPAAHFSHWGWAVAVPATLVNSPAGHLLWAAQESVVLTLVDISALKNPAAHFSHWGGVVPVGATGTLVNSPGGHLADATIPTFACKAKVNKHNAAIWLTV